MQRKRIAVVGGGIAGLATAWLLQQRHEVVLFERNDYIGGHTHTHRVEGANGPLAVDSGFIVYNEPNYPNLVKLFDCLGVRTREGDMSFSASLDGGRIEYAGSNLATLFAQPSNLLSPSHWRMLRDILRFNRDAWAALESGINEHLSLGEFLDHNGYGPELAERYLLPMAAAIWSCPASQMREYPAHSLLRFFANHGLINLNDRPQWRTVVGGSQQYVRKLLQDYHGKLHTDKAIEQAQRLDRRWLLFDEQGGVHQFDTLVLACHADQARRLLGRQCPLATRLLSQIRYQGNRALLHNDTRLMPRRRRAWSSWNYLCRQQGDDAQLSVSYWMNQLQGLNDSRDWLVTLNPVIEPDPALVHAEMHYEHPVFDEAALQAQKILPSIQGKDDLWLCGSYHGYGFHEDALRSAIEICRRLGAAPLWEQRGRPTREQDFAEQEAAA